MATGLTPVLWFRTLVTGERKSYVRSPRIVEGVCSVAGGNTVPLAILMRTNLHLVRSAACWCSGVGWDLLTCSSAADPNTNVASFVRFQMFENMMFFDLFGFCMLCSLVPTILRLSVEFHAIGS